MQSPEKKKKINFSLVGDHPLLPLHILEFLYFFGSPKFCHLTKLLDSLRVKLIGWKASLSSFVGRLTLVKHVLASMPIHISLAIPFPTKVCLLIKKITRNFLWSDNLFRTKRNIISWGSSVSLNKRGGYLRVKARMVRSNWLLHLGNMVQN